PTIPPLASPGTLPAYLDRPSIGAWPRPALFISWLTRRTAETPPRLPIRFQKSMNPAPRPLTTSGTSTPSPERMPMIRSSRFDGWYPGTTPPSARPLGTLIALIGDRPDTLAATRFHTGRRPLL